MQGDLCTGGTPESRAEGIGGQRIGGGGVEQLLQFELDDGVLVVVEVADDEPGIE
jgi:hypothetical protein